MLKPIEFSELTNRLRRNLMGSALLIIVIVWHKIGVAESSFGGMKLTGLTAEIILLILVLFLSYHAVAFAIRAYEDLRVWELNLTLEESGDMFSPNVVNLAKKLTTASETLDNVLDNSGLLNAQGQTIFSNEDAQRLKAITTSAEIYARRFENFPFATRIRFWVWDIGIAILVSATALKLYLSS